MTNFESSIRTIPYSQERVYAKLSDLSNLQAVKDRLPADQIKNLSFDSDTLSLNVSPVGQITLRIVEREPCQYIKFATVTSPLPFNLWMHIMTIDEEECNLKIVVDVEMNPFMKIMLQGPLQEALEKITDLLAAIPY